MKKVSNMIKFFWISLVVLVFAGCNQHINNKVDVHSEDSDKSEVEYKSLTERDEEILENLWTSEDFRTRKRYRYRSLEKAYQEPDSVINLALYAKALGEIPENIDTFKNLQLLGSDYNELSELPGSIANLKYLQKVHLNKNNFTEFPEVLTKNRYLKTILISDNKIERITPEIKNLVYLEDLVMNDNNLGEVPPEIFELRNLKVLGLRDNGIGSLPDKFDNFTNLEKVNLQNNNLKEIPPSLINPDLTRITLKGNPMNYAYIKQLQEKMPNTEIEF